MKTYVCLCHLSALVPFDDLLSIYLAFPGHTAQDWLLVFLFSISLFDLLCCNYHIIIVIVTLSSLLVVWTTCLGSKWWLLECGLVFTLAVYVFDIELLHLPFNVCVVQPLTDIPEISHLLVSHSPG